MFAARHFAPNVNFTSLPQTPTPAIGGFRQYCFVLFCIVLYCFVLFCIVLGLFSRAKPSGELYRAGLRRQQVKLRWPVPWRKFQKGLPMSGTSFGRPSRINSAGSLDALPPDGSLGSVSELFSCLYKLDEIVGQFSQIVLDGWVRTASRNFQKSHHYPFQVLAVLRL
jgi:hypothetical protein